MSAPLPALLRAYRDRRRMSQGDLAACAGIDRTFITRVEAGARRPSRETATALAGALRLTAVERDTLLAAAGFTPDDPVSLIADEPVVGALYAALRDEELHPAARDTLRQLVALAIEQTGDRG